MDFLKLVQKKDNKTDNKIIAATVIFVVLIMSTLVFWPNNKQNNLIAYLPDNASFYYHFTNKTVFDDNFLGKDVVLENIQDLKNVLGSNFLNLQEIVWFQTDSNSNNDNYLLRFSRLPKSFLLNLANEGSDFNTYSPQKNILLINRGEVIDSLEFNETEDTYFNEGVSIYWQKNKSPQFLGDFVNILEPLFKSNQVLLNYQSLAKDKHRISLLENETVDIKDISDFWMPKDFDFIFAFNNNLDDSITENIANDVLKIFIDSLPYYNLDKQVIKDRLLRDAIVWQKDDGWILASHRDWQSNILNFIDTLALDEVPRVLSDGTAYIELVASDEQNITEQQVNGQKISQIDDLFIWDIANKHYLSNKLSLIEELTANNYYLGSFVQDCLGDFDARVGDLLYLENSNISDGKIKDYLSNNGIDKLKISSYATGTISGLNICF